ncbi:MAG: porin PorA family protein, partial [Dehalococcoidia bacterium]
IAIDRSTLEMVPEYGDMSRQGQWAPPKLLGEGDSFLLWNPAANMPLEAKYVRSDTFQGLDVVVFKIDEPNVSLGPDPLAYGMEKYLSTEITLTIEPSSGAVVDQSAMTTFSYDIPQMGLAPSFISTVAYSDGTIAEMMDTARSARWLLLWFRTLIPWMAIALGAVLVVSPPTMFVIKRALKKSRADKPVELPEPTSLPSNS